MRKSRVRQGVPLAELAASVLAQLTSASGLIDVR